MYYGLNRTLCDVLREIRALDKQKNYGPLRSLVEEAQAMGNRMEARLHDQKDWESLKDEISNKKAELRELKKEIEANETLLKHLNKY